MSLKRRAFVHNLLLVPAVPAALSAQQPVTPPTQPASPPSTPAVQTPRQPQGIPALKLTNADLASETTPHFFSPEEFNTLQALGKVMVPALKGYPGAIEAKAPEFLDFLISVSPADRQKLYRDGLTSLDAHSKAKFQKPFAQLSQTEAAGILKPLMVVRLWPEDFPSDPVQNFIAQVHEDFRTATANSREWAEAAAQSGHRFTRRSRGSGLYWAPIDPISQG
jgi:Gluconate 2-dehydrogenase subunit 3